MKRLRQTHIAISISLFMEFEIFIYLYTYILLQFWKLPRVDDNYSLNDKKV